MTLSLGRVALTVGFLVAVVPRVVRAEGFTAHGTWHSNDGQLSGTWQAEFDVAGGDVGGKITLVGLPGLTRGNVSGSIRSGKLGFGVVYNDWQAAEFDGAVTATGLGGTFTTSAGVTGSWQGSLTPFVRQWLHSRVFPQSGNRDGRLPAHDDAETLREGP